MQQQLILVPDLNAILRGDRFVEKDGSKVLGIGLLRSVQRPNSAYHLRLWLVLSLVILFTGCKGTSMNSQAHRFLSDPQQLRMAHAIEDGDTTTIREMIQKDIVSANDYGTADKEQPISFLVYAVMVKNKDSIRALIANGADPNFLTPDGWSAIAEASRSPDESLLPLLLDSGGDPKLQAQKDRPMTFIAYSNERWKNLDLLLNRGVDINAQDKGGETLLMFMANVNDYDHMLELLQRGADPSITTEGNHVPVAWVVQEQAGRLVPDAEKKRQQVIQALEAKGVHFPVPPPPIYKWDTTQHKFVLAPR